MAEGLEVPIRYEAEDLRDAQNALSHSSIVWIFGTLFGGFAAILLGVVIWWLIEWTSTLVNAEGNLQVYMQAIKALGIGSAGIVAIAALFGALFWQSWTTGQSKILASLKSDDTRILRIGESGVTMHSRFGDVYYAWSYVRGISERGRGGGGVIAILLRDDSALIVPRRGLSAETAAQLREWVTRRRGRAEAPGLEDVRTLARDVGNIFWQGEVTYTRQDTHAAAFRPPQNNEVKAPGQNQAAKSSSEVTPQEKGQLKLSRAFFGWCLILTTSILLFVALRQPAPVPPAVPVKMVDHHSKWMLGASLLAALLWLIGWAIIIPELDWRRKRQEVTMPQHFAIGDQGITVVDARRRQWHAWGAIVDVEEYPHGLVLVSAEEWRLVVPLRGVDKEKRQALAKFARANMGGKALGFEVIQSPQKHTVNN